MSLIGGDKSMKLYRIILTNGKEYVIEDNSKSTHVFVAKIWANNFFAIQLKESRPMYVNKNAVVLVQEDHEKAIGNNTKRWSLV